MAKVIAMAAILIIAAQAFGNNDCPCDDIHGNVLTRKEKKESQLRARIIESAKRWIGVVEITGRNDHPMISKSMHLCGLDSTKGFPWCASSHSEIFHHTGVSTVISAAVKDWFKSNVVWERKWGVPIPKHLIQGGMSLGFHSRKYNRYAHISLSVVASDKRVYCAEGNTSPKGRYDPATFEIYDPETDVERDGDGFYFKVHSYYEIDVISDKCLQGRDFINRYDSYIQSVMR